MNRPRDAIATFLVTRDLLLDLARVGRRDLDLVDSLIQLGVVQANVRQIVSDPGSQLRYAYAWTNPPDALRRPIRIAALAGALNLSFETVRRRALRLCEAGYLVSVPGGLRVSASRFDRPQHLEELQQIDDVLRRTFRRLDGAGFFDTDPPPAPRTALAGSPLRAVGRLAGDFFLRMLASLRSWAGDPMDAAILLSLSSASDPETAANTGAPTPATSPRPVASAWLSRELGYSSETVRRRMRLMVDRGLCHRVAGGFVIPPTVIDQVLAPGLCGANDMNLRRLFRQLGELGAVSLWSGEATEVSPPAKLAGRVMRLD